MRNAIHAYAQEGLDCLKQESSRPKTVQAQFDQTKCEALRALLHQRPQIFGKTTSLWTLDLAAEVCFEQGLTMNKVSIETIRQAAEAGLGWDGSEPAHWITSPDPEYVREKNGSMLLRFVDGRPVSAVTTAFLEWLCEQMATSGKHVLVLIWDNASQAG